MVDCGEGTQRQLLTSGIGLKRLNKILITHSHLDHILGLAGLVSTMVRWETMEEMDIYGGADAIDRIRELLFSVVLRGNRITVRSEIRGNMIKPCFDPFSFAHLRDRSADEIRQTDLFYPPASDDIRKTVPAAVQRGRVLVNHR